MKNKLNNQQGVTLVELLVVIAIVSILATAIAEMYRVALYSWKSATDHSQYVLNSINVIKNISNDIHEAQQIQDVTSSTILLTTNDGEVRYSIQTYATKIKLIREGRSSSLDDWEQSPKFPIAEFPNTNQISFERKSPIHLEVMIINEHLRIQTNIAMKSTS